LRTANERMEVVKEIAASMEQGMSQEAACASKNVAIVTYKLWKANPHNPYSGKKKEVERREFIVATKNADTSKIKLLLELLVKEVDAL
jgi:hypothetical protein